MEFYHGFSLLYCAALLECSGKFLLALTVVKLSFCRYDGVHMQKKVRLKENALTGNVYTSCLATSDSRTCCIVTVLLGFKRSSSSYILPRTVSHPGLRC